MNEQRSVGNLRIVSKTKIQWTKFRQTDETRS